MLPFTLIVLAALALFAPVVIPALRRRWLSAPLMRRFSEVLPKLSETEQQALEAGTIGWDAELFSGSPDWKQLLATPPARLSADEQAFLESCTIGAMPSWLSWGDRSASSRTTCATRWSPCA